MANFDDHALAADRLSGLGRGGADLGAPLRAGEAHDVPRERLNRRRREPAQRTDAARARDQSRQLWTEVEALRDQRTRALTYDAAASLRPESGRMTTHEPLDAPEQAARAERKVR